jgi:hypothetical protein
MTLSKRLSWICFLFLAPLSPLLAQADDSITLEFKSPNYQEGLWETHEGGVLKTKDFDLQAKDIVYEKRNSEEILTHKLTAENNLLLVYQGRLFKADKFEYDFVKQEGVLKNGNLKYDLWYVQGKTILITPEKEIIVENGSLTSCPKDHSEWKIQTSSLKILNNSIISASSVVIYFLKLPIFWLPYFKVDINQIKGIPIKNRIHFRGASGTTLNFRYRFFSQNDWNTFLRLDYNLKGKAGLGLDAEYDSEENQSHFSSKNYITTNDIPAEQKKKTRFKIESDYRIRVESDYRKSLDNGKTTLELNFDYLSDYNLLFDQGDSFLHETPGKTDFRLRRLDPFWITNFYTRLRINSFETVKQELPTIEFNIKPLALFDTGIFSSSYLKISYLNFVFSEQEEASEEGQEEPTQQSNDFESLRTVFKQDFYKTFWLSHVSFTPKLNFTGIFYSNSPDEDPVWTHVQKASYIFQSDFSKKYSNYTHILTPFLEHEIVSKPSTEISKHYIFDSDDTLTYLNLIKFGLRNSLYLKQNDFLNRKINLSLYAHFFPNNSTIEHKLPQWITELDFKQNPRTTHLIKFVWNAPRRYVDFFQYRLLSSLTEKLTASFELSHRSPTYWRKADRSSYYLEALLSEESLIDSPVSYPRDALITKFHYQVTPLDSIAWYARFVKNAKPGFRPFEEHKIEYETKLHCNWALKLAYEKTMRKSHGFSVNLTLLDSIPKTKPLPKVFY